MIASSYSDSAERSETRSKDDDNGHFSKWDYSKEHTYPKGGLVHTLHGNIYQLKLQMLFLKRALQNGYEFNLGTEVEDAEKFDDIVFKYKRKDETGSDEIRFVQVKHKQDESIKITVNDLLKSYNKSDNDFSLQKYFISFSKIKKSPQFFGHKIKDFIIYTNIDFGNLQLIGVHEKKGSDDILQVTKSGNATKRFILTLPKNHDAINRLKETSDSYVLAETLIQHLIENKKLQLNNEVFSLYHTALSKNIFDVKVKKQKNIKGKELIRRYVIFREDFVNDHNLTQVVHKFRKVFVSVLKSKGLSFSEELSHKEIGISETFGHEQSHLNELPNDTIDDAEIEEFLEKLVFAVNQPNEIELGRLITEEMGQSTQFNLLNAHLVSGSFQSKMLDWFKQKRSEKGKEGVWLNDKSGRDFLNSIEKEVSSLVSVGISAAYPEELARYGILLSKNSVSKAIEEFLAQTDSSKKILHVIAPEDTLLSAINVNSTVEILKQREGFTEFKSNDGYIFVCLDTLLGERVQKYILDAFENVDNHRLLIIDCKSAAPTSEILKLFLKLTNVLETTDKKIIIIAKEQSILIDLFSEDLKSFVKDNTSFADMTEESKENLLKREVMFQGQVVSFDKLIHPSDERAEEIIDVHVIRMLLRGEQININGLQHNLGEINEYYIERKFRKVIFSKQNIKKYFEETGAYSDLFVISGSDCGLKHNNVFAFEDIDVASNKFAELCEKNKELNVHWLESDLNNLAWVKSYGSISNIVSCRKNEEVNNKIIRNKLQIEEAKFVHDGNYQKIVVISDIAGIGKSTVLTHLSMELKKDVSNLWVTKINLNDHTILLEETFRDKKNKGKHYLLNKLLASQISSSLEKKIFDNNLNNNGKVVLLFDGFDEISLEYMDIIIELLRSLNKTKAKKIFVTTRPSVKNKLELSLGVFSHELEPLTKPEQIEFLTKFWKKRLDLKCASVQRTERLQIYVTCLIDHIAKSNYNKEQDYIGIPLQTMMLAEIFQENLADLTKTWQGCKEYIDSELDMPILPNNYAFLDLYKDFVEKKFMKFYLVSKKSRDFTKSGERKKAANEYKIFKKKCTLLALQVLFSKEACNKLLSQPEVEELKALIDDFQTNEHDEGIVDIFIDDKPKFVHRTFAEYFASFHIAEKLLTDPASTLYYIDDVLLNMSPIFISSIIEQLDGKQEIITSTLKSPLLLFVVIEKFSNFIKSLLEIDFNIWPKKLDVFGKTPLNYAVEYGHFDFAKKIIDYADDIYEKIILKHGTFKKTDYENAKLVMFINMRDNEGNTALYYAIRKNYIDYAFELLLKGASIDILTDEDVDVLTGKMLTMRYDDCKIYENSILAAYANQDNKYRPIEEKLLLRAPARFNKLCKKDQSRILSYLFVHGRIKVIDTLLGTVNNLEERKYLLRNADNSYTPLDRVNNSEELSDNERLEITKYLYENGGPFNENEITEVLKAAAQFGALETFKYFIPMESRDKFNNHLYRACQCNQIEIIKYMSKDLGISVNDENANTALHAACDSKSRLKIIKDLLKNSCDVNALNDKGETPLFMAISRYEFNSVQYLVSKGADVNWKNLKGKTPLSCAIRGDDDKIITYLLSKGARVSENASQLIKDKVEFFQDRSKYNLNLINSNGYPKLHAAIQAGDFKWAQFLIRHGADINKEDVEGKTPLHWACTVQNIEFVELLLQYGAMFDVKDNNKATPLDLLPVSQSRSKICWLLNMLNKLYGSLDFMADLFKGLLDNKSKALADWGPYGRGHPDAWDGNNPMLFILNTQNSQGKILLHLAAADSNDSKAISILLKFNHDYLERKKPIIFQQYFQCPRYKDFQSMSIDKTDYQGNAPIHIAAQNGHDDIVLALLKKEVIYNSINLQGETPEVLALNNGHEHTVGIFQSVKNLFYAIEANNLLALLNCIESSDYYYYFKNSKNEFGKTPLHFAACLGRDVAVHLLLDNNADIEAVDLNKNTPLHVAAQNNEIEIVKLLLTFGAIFDANNSQGLRPFDLVPDECDVKELLETIERLFKDIQSDDPEIIIKNIHDLIENGKMEVKIIVNVRDSRTNTLLHYAAQLGELSIVEYLLANGASYNVNNTNEQSPKNLTNDQNIDFLLKAIDNMFNNIPDVYQEREVNIEIIKNVHDSTGKDLLFYASRLFLYEIVKFLVENGAKIALTDINYKLNKKYKPVDSNKFEMIKYMIDNGNVITTNYKGENPLMIAIKDGSSLDVIKYLVAKGSEVNAEDIFGNTPLSCAMEGDRADIIEYLLANEAQVSAQASQMVKDKLALLRA